MANTYKILGQSAPSATTNTDVYTVGTGKQAVISTITIANANATAISYRIAIRQNGASLEQKQYIAYGVTVPANDTTALTLGLSLGAGDVVTVYSSATNVSFGVFGSEIS